MPFKMFSRILISAVGAASAVSALVPRGVCNPDNCLRALRASSPQTRLAQAQVDCAAWLVVTATPSLSTATEYTTVTSTETAVEQITVTDESHTTFVSTVYETPTETVYTSTATSTVEAGGAGLNVPLLKRAAPTIPAYASPCSGAVRFSSACSCIGVSTAVATITASPSTITITLPTTVFATAQATSVVATSQVLVVDTTSTETITVPASTLFAVTTTTVTQTSSSTSTTSQAPTPTSFKVGISGGSHGAGYFGIYTQNGLDYAIWTSDASQAVVLTLNPDGSLYYNGKLALGDQNGVVLPFFFYNGNSVRKPLACAVGSDSILTCKVPGALLSNDKVGITTQANLTPVIYTGSESGLVVSSRPLISLKVVVI